MLFFTHDLCILVPCLNWSLNVIPRKLFLTTQLLSIMLPSFILYMLLHEILFIFLSVFCFFELKCQFHKSRDLVLFSAVFLGPTTTISTKSVFNISVEWMNNKNNVINFLTDFLPGILYFCFRVYHSKMYGFLFTGRSSTSVKTVTHVLVKGGCSRHYQQNEAPIWKWN